MTTRMTIDIPEEEHRVLKAKAAFLRVSLKDLVLFCIRDHISDGHQPNKETIEAFKETDQKKGLVHCENFDDFVAKLGL